MVMTVKDCIYRFADFVVSLTVYSKAWWTISLILAICSIALAAFVGRAARRDANTTTLCWILAITITFSIMAEIIGSHHLSTFMQFLLGIGCPLTLLVTALWVEYRVINK